MDFNYNRSPDDDEIADPTSNDSTHSELVDCRAIIAETTVDKYGGDNANDEFIGNSTSTSQLESIRFYVAAVFIPTLCVLGIIGNLFSIIVFTRRRMKVGLKFNIEQAGYEGLIALAVSDSLCCLSGLIAATSTGGVMRVVYEAREVLQLYMRLYVPCAQNAFVRTSTWLTVLTAAGRYAAICRPIHARRLIGVHETRMSVVAIFVMSFALELPSFWTFNVHVFNCASDFGFNSSDSNHTSTVDDYHLWLLDSGPFEANVQLRTTFAVLWTTLGFVIPAVALLFCNVQLVRSLRESAKLRRLVCRVASPHRGVGAECSRCRHYHGRNLHRGRCVSPPDRLTPTLIAIVGAFLVLVAPSELVTYVGRHSTDLVRHHAEPYDVILTVANFLQTIDFAFNFLLYCIVNVQFRNTCRYLVLSIMCRRRRSRRENSRIFMTSMIGRRRMLLELNAARAVVGTPTPAISGSCRCSTTRRTAVDCGTRDASLQHRHRCAAQMSLTVIGTTATSCRRSSVATMAALTTCSKLGAWERRKLSPAELVETAL